MLKGKTALVTGSTSGIGQAIAEALAAAGADVMLNGFGEAKAIERQVAELAKARPRASPATRSAPAGC
jgi:3-hydroxybutyrate dehydrogenase